MWLSIQMPKKLCHSILFLTLSNLELKSDFVF